MRFIRKSLIRKFSLAILTVECVVLFALGMVYTELFFRQVDQSMEERALIPGDLMARQLLRYESVGDPDVMAELVGGEFQDGMVVGADGRIYYALDPDLVGTSVVELSDVTVEDIYLAEKEPRVIRRGVDDEERLVAVTPMAAFEGAKPFFYAYIEVGVREAQQAKRAVALIFVVGSMACVFVTSLAIIAYTRKHIATPLGRLTRSADALRRGELDQAVTIVREDEIGSLAESFAAMRDAIAVKISELETANRSIEERESQRDALINAIPDLVLALDGDGRYLEIHAPEEDLLYKGMEELKGRTLHEVMPEADADMFLSVVQRAMATGVVQTLDYEMDVESGNRWFEARVFPTGGEALKGVVWVARDITYRKELEKRLRSSRDEAQRVSQRLTELDRTKSSLVSSVSHELRTPLTSLLGFSKLILKNFTKHFWPLAKGDHSLLTKGSQIVENLNILVHEGDRLIRLINDVLDLNKIEMGYMEWREERVNPADLTERAVSAVRGQFDNDPHLTLHVQTDDGLPDVTVDPDRMLQALLNLLTNAAKFTPAGFVTIKTLSPGPGLVRFEVVDTGPGVPPEEQDRIFDVFHQAGHIGPSDDKPSGAGLGLAITREIVERFGGSVWVETAHGGGAAFVIELPVG